MAFLGYSSDNSVRSGASINFYLGFEDSAAADLVADPSLTITISGSSQPLATVSVAKDKINGNKGPQNAEPWKNGFGWVNPYRFDVPAGWRSGLYTVMLNDEVVITFVVKPQIPGADKILLVYPLNTVNAYVKRGGNSLYPSTSPGRSYKVSFDRPLYVPLTHETYLLQWLNTQAYIIDYCTDIDLHTGDPALDDYNLLLILSHSEYWTASMRDNVERFIRRGGNVAIFGGNICYRQVRLENNNRTLVCYKDAAQDLRE